MTVAARSLLAEPRARQPSNVGAGEGESPRRRSDLFLRGRNGSGSSKCLPSRGRERSQASPGGSVRPSERPRGYKKVGTRCLAQEATACVFRAYSGSISPSSKVVVLDFHAEVRILCSSFATWSSTNITINTWHTGEGARDWFVFVGRAVTGCTTLK